VDDRAVDGLRAYRNRSSRAALGGVVAAITGALLASAVAGVGAIVSLFGLMAFATGVVGVLRTMRITRLVQTQGWRCRSSRFRVIGGGNGQPALMLWATASEPEAVLSVSTTVFRWGAFSNAKSVWLTGDPGTRFAAVATPDFGTVIVVKRSLLKSWKRRLRRIATST
jgi:hypothetical protein